MTDWQIGDIALCIGSDIPGAENVFGEPHPIIGHYYPVTFVHPPLDYAPEQGVGLGFDSCPLLYCSPGFVKVRADGEPATEEQAAWLRKLITGQVPA